MSLAIPGRGEVFPPVELAVVAAVEVIAGPHLAVGTGAAEVDAGAVVDVKEEGAAPAVDELAAGIEAGVGVGEEAKLVAVPAPECGGELLVGPEAEGGVSFDEEGEIAEGMGQAAEIVLGAGGRLGVISEDELPGQWRCGREELGGAGRREASVSLTGAALMRAFPDQECEQQDGAEKETKGAR